MHCTLIRITRAPAVWWQQRPTKPVLVEDVSWLARRQRAGLESVRAERRPIMIRHAEAGVGHLARTGRAIYDATGHTTQSRARRRSAEPSGQGDCANCGSARSWGTDAGRPKSKILDVYTREGKLGMSGGLHPVQKKNQKNAVASRLMQRSPENAQKIPI
jgi:hypothetical protein